MRVAVVHHWFVTRGGGERVAECIAALFPKAEIFTLVASEAGLPDTLRGRRLHASFLQKMPLARTHHRHFMPLYPRAVESLDLRGFDLVLSSDSGPVKGVRLDPEAVQICYCHSPMRYLWDGYEAYRSGMSGVTKAAFTASAERVRRWDREAAQRVNYFLANSEYVARRIERSYGRAAGVLHPPIDVHRAPGAGEIAPEEHYLCAGRLVGYKRTEILIEACRRMGRRLRVAGAGPELARLERLAETSGAEVEFLGEISTERLWQEYARCRALLFAADEDFGMVPLEAQACGRPVLAYGWGGSLETVRVAGAEPTGAYFAEQTAESAAEAMKRWESDGERVFRPEWAREWAAGFSTPIFLERYRRFVLEKVPGAEREAVSAREAAGVVTA